MLPGLCHVGVFPGMDGQHRDVILRLIRPDPGRYALIPGSLER